MIIENPITWSGGSPYFHRQWLHRRKTVQSHKERDGSNSKSIVNSNLQSLLFGKKYFLYRTQTIFLPFSFFMRNQKEIDLQSVIMIWTFQKGVSHSLLFDNFQTTRLCFYVSVLAFSYFIIFHLAESRKTNEKCHLWVWAC